jgi:hypothetical protein
LKIVRTPLNFSQGLGVGNPRLESMDRFYRCRCTFEGALKVFPVVPHARFQSRGFCESKTQFHFGAQKINQIQLRPCP